eukprot:CAMPEP_0185844548 /NCGR_PEP_ID=MMETSP1354-20130828/667_1 /TAXON_ID=708628 /ORGANISM="Erythrolobus madagascarensis, Strain CCMP3276" /LENGTH=477 /DNA_ID=CAMNT_0028544231 /DNA_START=35 /DNA_END=1468 /DNA_ORIENTATION=+
MRVVCLVCLVLLGVLSGVHGRTIQAAKNDGGPSVAIKRGSRPKIPSAKNPLPEMIFTTNNRAGYGNQLNFIYSLLTLVKCLGAEGVAMPSVFPHKNRPRYPSTISKGIPIPHRVLPGYLSDYSLAMYDVDTIRDKLGLNVHHFRTACSCFDYVLLANDPKERRRSEGHRMQTVVYEDVDEAYHSTWREINVERSDELADRNRHNSSFAHPWDLFPEERDRLIAGLAPSPCGNRDRCVFIPVLDIADVMSELRYALPGRCNLIQGRKYRDNAETSVLPGKMLMEAARAVLPSYMKAEDTLIIHLRYEPGEYSNEVELCQTAKAVCYGRNEYYVVDIAEFGRLVKQQAEELNCTHVFPILPRQFMWEGLVIAVAEQFGLKAGDLVSSRDLLDINIMLFERTLAVICRGFIGETKKTTFASTISHQRRGLELPPMVPLENVLATSSVNTTYLHSKHVNNVDKMFEEISRIAQRARGNSQI